MNWQRILPPDVATLHPTRARKSVLAQAILQQSAFPPSGGEAGLHRNSKPGGHGQEVFDAEPHLSYSTIKIYDEPEKSGKYGIRALFTEGFSIGNHSLYINGQKVEKEIKLWNLDFMLAEQETMLGEFDLKQGENVLKVVVDGKDEKSFGYVFTLDYLRLIPAK